MSGNIVKLVKETAALTSEVTYTHYHHPYEKKIFLFGYPATSSNSLNSLAN